MPVKMIWLQDNSNPGGREKKKKGLDLSQSKPFGAARHLQCVEAKNENKKCLPELSVPFTSSTNTCTITHNYSLEQTGIASSDMNKT